MKLQDAEVFVGWSDNGSVYMHVYGKDFSVRVVLFPDGDIVAAPCSKTAWREWVRTFE